jgi:MFS family permease
VAEPVADSSTHTTSPNEAQTSTASLGIKILTRLAAAFTFPNFRNLWLAAFTSAVGTWMQRFAQQWLILTLTGSAFYLGLDAFVGEVPLLLFTLIGGVIADRHDRRYLLMASQSLQMVCAITLTGLVFFDLIEVHYVLALSFISGLAQAFGGPAFQSLVPTLVPRATLPNAIALNSIQFNLAQMVGPLIGGAVLATLGMVACFGVNGASFLAVIIVLSFMRLPHPTTTRRERMLVELKNGLSYVHNQSSLLWLTVLAAATTTLGVPIRAFLPMFAEDAVHLSLMMTALGGGAVTGALMVAWLGKFKRMGQTLLLAQMAFGGLVATFAFLPFTAFSYVVLYLCGMTLLMIFSLTHSLVQLAVPNELRGRVISIYLVAFRGGMALGSLVSGYLMTLSSAPVVIGINAILLVLVAIYVLLRSPIAREL